MTTKSGPDADVITRYIVDTFDGVDVVSAGGATFFSCDPEKHWPNFATIVTTDEHDMGSPSNLSARPDVFRLNIGVSRPTFDATVGSIVEPDFAELDSLLPHPVYARQRWISILNPSQPTFDDVVAPMLAEAHGILSARRKRPPTR